MGSLVDIICCLRVNAGFRSGGPPGRVGYKLLVRRVARHRVMKNRER